VRWILAGLGFLSPLPAVRAEAITFNDVDGSVLEHWSIGADPKLVLSSKYLSLDASDVALADVFLEDCAMHQPRRASSAVLHAPRKAYDTSSQSSV